MVALKTFDFFQKASSTVQINTATGGFGTSAAPLCILPRVAASAAAVLTVPLTRSLILARPQ